MLLTYNEALDLWARGYLPTKPYRTGPYAYRFEP